jgi:hypothetical protein
LVFPLRWVYIVPVVVQTGRCDAQKNTRLAMGCFIAQAEIARGIAFDDTQCRILFIISSTNLPGLFRHDQ